MGSVAKMLLDQVNRTGSYEPLPRSGDRKSHKMVLCAQEVLDLVDATPDTTLAEIATHLHEQRQVKASKSLIWRLLDRHGLSFKKTAHASEQQRPDVLSGRLAWFDLQPDPDPARLVLSIKQVLQPRWRGATGARYGENVAVRRFRMATGAPCPSSRPCVATARMPLAYSTVRSINNASAPGLTSSSLPRSSLVTSLFSTTWEATRQRQSDRPSALPMPGYGLPPYSPDLNAIEQAFAKIKHWMRMAQKRKIDNTWRHPGSLTETIPPSECANFLQNAGYASVKT